jgi:hypothetical protein
MPMSGEDDYLIVRRCVGCVSEASLENDDITIGIIIRSNVILVAVLWDLRGEICSGAFVTYIWVVV